MKIALIGNCQTEALSWYFQYLFPHAQVHWINFSLGRKDIYYNGFGFLGKFRLLENRHAFTKKFLNKVKLTQDPDDYISSCDLVIYQCMFEHASPRFHTQRLKSLISKDAIPVKIPSFHIDKNNIDETLQGMRDRCDRNDTDIHIDDILKNVPVESMISGQKVHPKAIYFLEVARLICLKLGVNFFNEEDYQMFMKTGFPFG